MKITDPVDLSRPLRESHRIDDFYHYQQSTCVEVPAWGACITNTILHTVSHFFCLSPQLLSRKHLAIKILKSEEMFYSPISDLLKKSLIEPVSFLNITFSLFVNTYTKSL